MFFGRNRPIETMTVPRHQYLSGDGSTVYWLLDFTPPTAASLEVYISGILIHPDSWSIAGAGLTFNSPPTAGTDNIYVRVITEVGLEIVPSDGSVTPAKTVGMQNVIQFQYGTDNTARTHSTTLPADDTIPQITEGDQVLTVNMTPTDAANILVFDYGAFVAASATGVLMTMALFKNGTNDALSAVASHDEAGATYCKFLTNKFVMVAGSTSAATFQLRFGAASGSMYINSHNGSSQYFGGVMPAYLHIWELKP